MAFYPTKHLKLTVDKEKVLKNGIVPQRFADKIVKEVQWDVKSNYLFKNDLMLFDFLASNDWKRPIYFASPSTVSNVFNVAKYCQMEGWVYKFMPVQPGNDNEGMSYLPFGLFSSFIQTSPETDWENQGKSTSFRTEYSVVLRDPDSYRDSVALCVINIL